MVDVLDFFKCEDCKVMVMVTHSGPCQKIECDGQAMRKLEQKMKEEGLSEKHIPVVEKTAKGIRVKVGAVTHPMVKEHYIQWISVKHGRNMYIHALRPGEPPEAEFPVNDANVKSLIYCNVHDLWTNKK